VRKDLITFSRDRLWMVLTPLALLAFVAIYWLMPARVDETLVLGVHPPAMASALRLAMGVAADEPALTLLPFETEAALAAAIAGDGPEGEARPFVGISLPLDLLVRARLGQSVTARVYVDAAVPSEVRGAMTSAVREVVATAAGLPLPVSWAADELIVLGTDRAGAQVPLRERMRPDDGVHGAADRVAGAGGPGLGGDQPAHGHRPARHARPHLRRAARQGHRGDAAGVRPGADPAAGHPRLRSRNGGCCCWRCCSAPC
jgi:hypothetical protein